MTEKPVTPIPDFEAMKLELLLSTPSQGKDCSPYNNALWLAKENRLKKLEVGIEECRG